MMIKACRVSLYAQRSPTRACNRRTEHSDYSSKIPAAAEAQAVNQKRSLPTSLKNQEDYLSKTFLSEEVKNARSNTFFLQ
jgi:hypothetical protein